MNLESSHTTQLEGSLRGLSSDGGEAVKGGHRGSRDGRKPKGASIYDVQTEGGQEIPQICGQTVLSGVDSESEHV